MTERLLRVETNHFVAGAVFVREGERWKLQRCAPILKWMRPLSTPEIKAELDRRRFRYEWVSR